jgi:O-antigen ligase
MALITANGLRIAPNVTWSDAFLLLGVVALLGSWTVGRIERVPVPPWLLLGGSLVVTSALLVALISPSLPINDAYEAWVALRPDNATGGAAMAVRLVIALIGLPIVIAAVCTTFDRVRLLTDAWLLGSCVCGAVAILAALGFDLQHTLTGAHYARIGGDRYTGLTVHANHLGLAMELALPLMLFRFNEHPRYKVGAVVLIAAELVSGSRAALIGVVIGIVVVAWLRPQFRRPLLFAAAAGAIAVILGFGHLDVSSLSRFTDSDLSAQIADEHRAAALRESIDLVAARPWLGYGFQVVRAAHNVVLQILAAGGILALIGYCIAIVGATRVAWRMSRSQIPDDLRITAQGLFATMIVWVCSSLLQNNIADRFLYAPIALIVGLWAAAEYQTRSGTRRAQAAGSPAVYRRGQGRLAQD